MSFSTKKKLIAVALAIVILSVTILVSSNSAGATKTLNLTIFGGEVWADYKNITMSLKFPEPKAVTIDPAKTILQIVDMQEDFVGTAIRGTKYKPVYITNIQKLLQLARDLDMTVVHQFSTKQQNPYWKSPRNMMRFLADPTHKAIISELAPIDRSNEYTVYKFSHDIFLHTYMEDLLNKLPSEIDTVIITGINTNVCNLYTLEGYCARGYKVIIPMDGNLCGNQQVQAMTLQVMATHSSDFPATMTLSNMITFEINQ